MFLNSVRFTVKCLKCTNPARVVRMNVISEREKYSNWAHRQPSKIVNEEEILEHVQAAKGPNEFDDLEERPKPLKIRPKASKLKKKIIVTEKDVRLREDGTLKFKDMKENNRILTTLMMQVRSRKTRDRNSRIILEGHRLITDAIQAGVIPEIIVFSRVPDALKLPLPDEGVKLYKAPYREIQTWSTLSTSPGIMGFFKIPDTELTNPHPESLPLTIICDNVREPGNMGSIMRAAAGVGCKKLILVKGCVDIWDPKVLRSATGAHFRFPIFNSKTWSEVQGLIDPESNVFIADNNVTDRVTEPVIIEQATESEILAANENSEPLDDGDSSEEEEEQQQKQQLTNEEAELLELEENLERKVVKTRTISEEKLFEQVTENMDKHKNYIQKMNELKLAKDLAGNIPVIPYYATDYTSGETVIVIGGEAAGLSLEALSLVRDKNGIRINIPMTNGVDSLNAGMALGIVAFEIKRQFSLASAKNKSN